MPKSLEALLTRTLNELRAAGQYKQATVLEGAQGPLVTVGGREVLMLSANNYLGLANDPCVVAGAKAALDKHGMGTASVRFMAGTMACHLELERKIAAFLDCEAALTYMSCWDANIGLIPTLAAEADDAIFSDSLNHASIIDGIRLSKARRHIFKHGELHELKAMLKQDREARIKLIITDGVFSVEGDIADLPQLKALADENDALLIVDESHATGVLGEHGRGTVEHFGISGKGIVQTSTLGKTLGGACGGYVAGSRTICDYLLQASRPHLFSNALPPAVCGGAMAALDVLQSEPQRLKQLRDNAAYFRQGIAALGLKTLPGITPIVPVIVGETARALEFQKKLLAEGIYVCGFGPPVVPEGQARLRAQISAVHTREQLDRALAAFKKVGGELGLI